MKGLLITNDFPPMTGGLASWYSRLCATVPDRVIVLAPRVKDDHLHDGSLQYRVIRCRAPIGANPVARLMQILVLGLRAFRLLRRGEMKAVHIGQLHLGVIGLAIRRLLGFPYVLYLHGGEMALYLRFGMVRAVARAIVRAASIVVVNSEFTRSQYEAMGITHPRTELLTMGVSAERFRPDLDLSGVRARFGLDGTKVILTVGRLVERKGHDVTIEALRRLPATVGTVSYLIVGTGPEEHRLRRLAQTIECAHQIIFAGYVPDKELPYVYASCDVFVMPSRALPVRDGVEGFGIVFLEAGACAKPVIGGRSGGVAEAVWDGKTGVLVDPTDAEELARVLTRLLSSPEEAQRLGRGGRQRAEALAAEWSTATTRIWDSVEK